MNNKTLFLFSAVMSLLLCSSPQKNSTGTGEVPSEKAAAAMLHYTLPTFYITTCDRNARMGSLSLTLMYINNDDITGKIKLKIDEINDAIDGLLKGKQYNDLDSDEDVHKLIDEIEKKINEILLTGELVSVRLENILID